MQKVLHLRDRDKEDEHVLKLGDLHDSILANHYKQLSFLKVGDQQPPALNDDGGDWLWLRRGQVQVIAIPYLTGGQHYATSTKQFLPIIKHLQETHKLGYGQSDVRGLNMLFIDNEHGTIIDFDYTKKVKREDLEVFYPHNYRGSLPDGDRVECKREPIVRQWHDWRALIDIIYCKHFFVTTDDDVEDKLRIIYNQSQKAEKDYKKAIIKNPKAISSAVKACDRKYAKIGEELKRVIEKWNDYDIEPAAKYEEAADNAAKVIKENGEENEKQKSPDEGSVS